LNTETTNYEPDTTFRERVAKVKKLPLPFRPLEPARQTNTALGKPEFLPEICRTGWHMPGKKAIFIIRFGALKRILKP
jgi:hypothetical protein